eukprot:750483-Hanusia_phi.AAC.2
MAEIGGAETWEDEEGAGCSRKRTRTRTRSKGGRTRRQKVGAGGRSGIQAVAGQTRRGQTWRGPTGSAGEGRAGGGDARDRGVAGMSRIQERAETERMKKIETELGSWGRRRRRRKERGERSPSPCGRIRSPVGTSTRPREESSEKRLLQHEERGTRAGAGAGEGGVRGGGGDGGGRDRNLVGKAG